MRVVPDPARQGGDTIADATVILAIPYSDTGTTTGYVDDYDEVGATGSVEVTGDAEIPTWLFDLPRDCYSPAVNRNIIIGACTPGSMTMQATPGDEIYWFAVMPTTCAGPEPLFEYDDVLWFTGLMPQPVATETATWTAVRSLFK